MFMLYFILLDIDVWSKYNTMLFVSFVGLLYILVSIFYLSKFISIFLSFSVDFQTISRLFSCRMLLPSNQVTSVSSIAVRKAETIILWAITQVIICYIIYDLPSIYRLHCVVEHLTNDRNIVKRFILKLLLCILLLNNYITSIWLISEWIGLLTLAVWPLIPSLSCLLVPTIL